MSTIVVLIRAYSELRNSLVSLNTLSDTATRRLDNTYYSVLEKLSALQNTISSLRELAAVTQSLNSTFTDDADSLVFEVNDQISIFDNFNSQSSLIQRLQERVNAGRQKIQSLGGRVDGVKTRVESWERGEQAWQDRTRKRLKVLWIIISVVAGFFVCLVLFRYTPAKSAGPGQGVIRGWNASEFPALGDMSNETFKLTRPRVKGSMLEGLKRKDDDEELKDDPRLRIFDEL